MTEKLRDEDITVDGFRRVPPDFRVADEDPDDDSFTTVIKIGNKIVHI